MGSTLLTPDYYNGVYTIERFRTLDYSHRGHPTITFQILDNNVHMQIDAWLFSPLGDHPRSFDIVLTEASADARFVFRQHPAPSNFHRGSWYVEWETGMIVDNRDNHRPPFNRIYARLSWDNEFNFIEETHRTRINAQGGTMKFITISSVRISGTTITIFLQSQPSFFEE